MSLGEFIPSSNTKLLLHLNGNSTDSSGNNNNGTDTNITYSQANGRFGQGAGFNGLGRVTITNTILPSTATNYTISAWINTANDTTEKTIIADRYGLGSYAYKYRFYIEKTTLKHRIYNSGLTQLASSGVIPATTWTHVAVTVTVGGTCYLYINGKQDGSASYVVGSYPPAANQSTIGVITGPVTEGYFNGSIDEVIVENVAWSAEKVKKYYTMTKGRFATL
jgi:hypothetical protein